MSSEEEWIIEDVRLRIHHILTRMPAHRNQWPDLEVVNFQVVQRTNEEQFNIGWAVGHAPVHRQITKTLPMEIRRKLDYLPGWLERGGMIPVWFDLAPAKGQIDGAHNRNIWAIFEPRREWSIKTKKMSMVFPGLIAELGCAHEYETTNAGRSFYKYDCKKCSHHYEVDSGD